MSTERISHWATALARQNEAVTAAWNRCFDSQTALAMSDAVPLTTLTPPEAFDARGLAVYIAIGKDVLLVLAPENVIPEWAFAPDATQTSRLETLAMEWGMSCVPEDWSTDSSGTCQVAGTAAALKSWGVREETTCVPVSLDEGKTLWFLWPVDGDSAVVVATEPLPEPAAAASTLLAAEKPETSDVPHSASPPAVERDVAPPQPAAARPAVVIEQESPPLPPRLQRLIHLPVKLVVQLAHKRIQVSQLLALAPGSLITFDKACEDRLDLYVNNALLGRGEAVKVGEKFGLKIQEVGSVGPFIPVPE